MLSRIQQEQRRLVETMTVPVQVTAVLILTILIARWVALGNDLMFIKFVLLALGAMFAAVIWFNPYLGLVVSIAALPTQAVLKGIPYGTLMTSALGGLALFALIFQRQKSRLFSYGTQIPMVLALGFVVWQFITYPEASYYGNRNWLFTYLQLFVLFWLASELLTPKRQLIMMAVYAAACVISALYAFSQANIVASFAAGSGLVRAAGLAENQNSLAFYLVLGFVFTAFLHRQVSSKIARWATPLFIGAYGALVLGIVGTVSRSGFLSLILAALLVILFWTSGPSGNKRFRRIVIPILALIFAAAFLIPSTYWTVMENTIFTSSVNQAGNFGNRNALLKAGLRAWWDHPIVGVGINRFRLVSGAYLDPQYQAVAGHLPHNFYATLLSETGLIGFMLFFGWMALSMRDLFQTIRMRSDLYSPFAAIWLIVFILFLFRGLAASTMHYDKMLWMMGGISMLIYQSALREQRRLNPQNGKHE